VPVDLLKYRQLLIGGHSIRIVYVLTTTIVELLKRSKEKTNNNEGGFWDPDTNTIYVASDTSRSNQCVILIHESLHAIEAMIGITFPERVIVQLSEYIYAFLKNNGIIK